MNAIELPRSIRNLKYANGLAANGVPIARVRARARARVVRQYACATF